MAQSSSTWRIRPIFISSTFKDMHAERDHLRTHVFPRIEEELRRRRVQLEPIDLRLGVKSAESGTEEARELLVLKVCLDEIKHSRPFLVVLLGDRYGWRPAEERLAAAAREQGFTKSVAGKSVTALEIEFGVLKEDPDQKQRSLIFFRSPLPCERMPEELRPTYSDALSPDPHVREGHARLEILKTGLRADPELGPRVFEYSAVWDAAANRVVGLETFGELVFQHLWAALDEETRAFVDETPLTWEEQERAALVEFVEQRSLHFTGREELLGQLLDLSLSPVADGAPWGACVTGAPGSGKSALFAALFQRLSKEGSALILANAAGGTPRGGEVDAMLRRWIRELAEFLGVADPMPEKATPDDVDNAFYSLLHRTSTQRRVVVLFDALDQSEPTPRSQHLTWLRAKQWPANARIIATSLPDPGVGVLSQCAGIEALDLPPLTAGNAEQIAREVWARYHQPFDAAVLHALTGKCLADDTAACGNPLWLTLALEQLSLLDADDFARIEREFTGSSTERLRGLMLEIAGSMPADVEGLYGWLLAWMEKAFGQQHARAYAVAITLSRFGWRESDLLRLVPRLASLLFPGESIDEVNDLKLAALRRGFRAHLTRRGAAGRLDFLHAQMRRMILARTLGDAELTKQLHRAIADHLEMLHVDDPLRETELMVHLIAGDDSGRAARLYASLPAASAGLVGATQALVRHITLGMEQESNPHLEWTAGLLRQDGMGLEQVAHLGRRFHFELHDALENTTDLSTRRAVLEATQRAFEHRASSDPSKGGRQHDLSVSQEKMGDVLLAQGDSGGALKAYRASLATRQRLASSYPSDADLQRSLSVSQSSVGNVLRAQGDLTGALAAHRASLAIARRLASSNPSNAAWQRDLGISQVKVGDVLLAQGDSVGALEAYRESLAVDRRLASSDPSNADWQRDLSISQEKIANILQAMGDSGGALKAYRESLEIAQRLASSDPSNSGRQRDLSVSLVKIGDALLAQGDLDSALQVYRESLEIARRLASSDPSNAGWQRDLSAAQDKMGEVLQALGDLVGALQAYRESLVIAQRLASSDLPNTGWQRDLSVSQDRIGDVLLEQGDLRGALKTYRESLAIRERLALSDPSSADRQRDLSVSQEKLGDALQALGDLVGALQAYRESLAIAQRLASSDSSNADRQRDLSVGHIKVGEALLAQGDLEGALQAHRESLAIAQRLASSDPSNLGWQRDLSISQDRIGAVLMDQGDAEGALQAHRESLAIAQRLASSDPSNLGWQRDLSASHIKIGEALQAGDDLGGALQAYREALKIRQLLASADLSNAGWQRDLGVSWIKLGDVLQAKGDLGSALQSYRESLAIAQRLVSSDPTNDGWQRDLSIGHDKVGEVLQAQGDLAGALQAYRESLTIAQRLVSSDLSNADRQRDLSVSQNYLGDVLLAQKDLEGALHAYRESLTIRQRLVSSDPSNTGWLRDLGISYTKVGGVLLRQRNVEEAAKAYGMSQVILQHLTSSDPSKSG